MIVKFNEISGDCFANLLVFIHSEENRVSIPRQDGQLMIVRVKDVKPDNQAGGTWYGLTLEIQEWIAKGDEPGQDRVDSKYLLKAYRILGQEPATQKRESKWAYSLLFRWCPNLGFFQNSGVRRTVMVTPPKNDGGDWLVTIPAFDKVENFSGEDAENRAFSAAVGYATCEG